MKKFFVFLVAAAAIFFSSCAATKVVGYGGEGSGPGVKVYVPRRESDKNATQRPASWLKGRRIIIQTRRSRYYYGNSDELVVKTGHYLRQFGAVIVGGDGEGGEKYDRIVLSSQDEGRNKLVYLEYYFFLSGDSPLSTEGRGYDLSEGTSWGYSSSTMSRQDWQYTAWDYAVKAAVEALARAPVEIK